MRKAANMFLTPRYPTLENFKYQIAAIIPTTPVLVHPLIQLWAKPTLYEMDHNIAQRL